MSARTAERETFLADIIVTALEGGIGYWSRCSVYHWYDPSLMNEAERKASKLGAAPNGGNNAYAVISDCEGDDFTDREITLDVIAKGIQAIVKGECKGISPNRVAIVKAANRENDLGAGDCPHGDVDSDIADCIVQAGLFGEVVYG